MNRFFSEASGSSQPQRDGRIFVEALSLLHDEFMEWHGQLRELREGPPYGFDFGSG